MEIFSAFDQCALINWIFFYQTGNCGEYYISGIDFTEANLPLNCRLFANFTKSADNQFSKTILVKIERIRDKEESMSAFINRDVHGL